MGQLANRTGFNGHAVLALRIRLCLFTAVFPPFCGKKGLNLNFHLQAWWSHLSRPTLLRLYAMGFVLTSIFVTLFNYITFRLDAAPYFLSQTQISLIFLSYSLGMVSSSLAGRLAQRYGRQSMVILGFVCMGLGIACTLAQNHGTVYCGNGFWRHDGTGRHGHAD